MNRARRRIAAAAALALMAGCGQPSSTQLARPLPSGEIAVARSVTFVRGLAQGSPLDGVTQSTPLRAVLPDGGVTGGSLRGTVDGPSTDPEGPTVQDLGTAFSHGGWVILETPDRQIYVQDGRALVALVDTRGHFTFGQLSLPAGLPLVVAAWGGSPPLWLEASTIVQHGPNSVAISAASTLASLYLQAQARLRGRSISAFDPGRWQSLVDLTAGALADGHLRCRESDLELMHRDVAIANYQRALAGDPELADAWQSLLGPAPAPVPIPTPPPGPPTASVCQRF